MTDSVVIVLLLIAMLTVFAVDYQQKRNKSGLR
jgi:heme/copper-type cytochrome/quinol oxidase subunit 2